MAKQTKKKNYTEEFKRDAVRLMRNRGKRTVAQIADDLGVSDGMLYRWAGKPDKASTAKHNEQGETLEQENRRLRKDVERLRVERAILKKAAAFVCHASVH
jgi:transposase